MRKIDKILKNLSGDARRQIAVRFRGALEIQPDSPAAQELIKANLMEKLGGAFFWRSGRERYMPTKTGFEAYRALHDRSHERHMEEARRRSVESMRQIEQTEGYGEWA